jgi:CheY-like chemotaxis protein
MKPLALVVENDSGTRRLLDVLMTRIGFEVDVVPSGTDALLLLERVEYSALVLDLLLPGRSGREVLQWLAEMRPALLPRTIVISSAPPSVLEQLRFQWPALRVLRKPFELGAFLDSAHGLETSLSHREIGLPEQFGRASVRAGAKTGVVVITDGVEVFPVSSFGYPEGFVESYFPLRVDAPMPICVAIQRSRPVWIASTSVMPPEYASLAPVFVRNGSRALAAVPLIRDGRAIGAAGWTFREPRMFGEQEQQVFAGIAEWVAEWIAPESSGKEISARG